MEGLCMLVIEDITPEQIAAVLSLLPEEDNTPRHISWDDDFNERGGEDAGRKAMPVIDSSRKN